MVMEYMKIGDSPRFLKRLRINKKLFVKGV